MHTVSIHVDRRHHLREMCCGCEFVTQCLRLEAERRWCAYSGDGGGVGGGGGCHEACNFWFILRHSR